MSKCVGFVNLETESDVGGKEETRDKFSPETNMLPAWEIRVYDERNKQGI